MGMGMGMTHDVKNSKTGKNGAATEVFQLMNSRSKQKKPLSFLLPCDA